MTLRIAQLSDSHIALDYPQRLTDLEHCIQCINAEQPQPDVVVHTGDITHNGLAEEYTAAKSVLSKLRAPCFVLAGNKDKRVELLRVFADGRFLRQDSDWIQYSIEDYAVRLLVVDTVHASSNKGQICQQRLALLEQMLESDKTKPVVVFMHHPPFPATGVPDPHQYEDWAQALAVQTLLCGYTGIQGLYCGHVHRNIDSSIAGFPANAITCLAGDLRKGEVSDAQRAKPVYKMITVP